MKPNAPLRQLVALTGCSLLAITCASAAIVTWDGDTSTTWATAGNWDTAPVSSLTTDIANFNLATYDGVTVFAPTVDTATSIAGITIGASNGTMTLTNTAALSIGASGISIANGAGAFTISGSTTLGASQSWTNNSTNLFTFGAVTAGANTLTIGGSGNTVASGIISGTNGALTKEGAGILTLNAANTYTGATTVNGGELRWGITNAIAGGALNINDGGTVNIQGFSDSVGTITIAKGGSLTGTTGVLSTSLVVANDGGTFSGFSAGAGLRLTGGVTYNSTGPGSTTLQIDHIFIPDQSVTVFDIANGDAAIDFEITGTLSGGGNNIGRTIRKTGAGVMQLSGSTANTTSTNQMPLEIWDGTVIFNKSAEVNAIPNSAITIGNGIGASGSAMLQYRTSSNQIASSPITINSDGLFDLNGFSETLGAVTVNSTGQLQLNNGQLTTTTLALNASDGNTTTVSLGASGTLTLGGDVTFNAAGSGRAQITGSALSLGAANRIFNVGLGSGADYDLFVDAGVSGAGRSLTKSGQGRLTVSGSNSYTGSTTLNAGTLKLDYSTNNDSKLSNTASTGTLLLNGGTLELSGGSHTETVLSTTLNNGMTFIRQSSGSSTLSMGAITFTAGAIDFSAENIATTTTGVTNGILSQRATVAGANFAMKSGSNIVAYDYATSGSTGYTGEAMSANTNYLLSTNGASTLSGTTGAASNTLKIANTSTGSLAVGTNTLTLGAILFAGSADYDLTTSGAGKITPTILHNYGTDGAVLNLGALGGVLTQFGTGKTILTANSTVDTGINIFGGTVQFTNNLQIGTNASAQTISLNNGTLLADTTGGSIALDNAGSFSRAITLGAGGGTLDVIGGNTLTVSGVISGTGNALTIGSASTNGTVVLTSNSTYTGSTTIKGGILQLGNGGATGTLSSSSTIVNNGTLIINHTSAQTLGAISGTGSVTMSGTNTLTLSNNNTFSGGFTLNSGSIAPAAGNYNGFGTGLLTINATAGDTLSLPTTSAAVIANDMEWNTTLRVRRQGTGGTGLVTFDGDLVLKANSGIFQTQTTFNANATFNGNISEDSSSRSFTFSGSGAGSSNLTLNGQNTFTGNLTNSNTGGSITIGGSGHLGGGNYAGAITANGAFTYSSSANQILSGNISGTTLIKNTSADSILTLSGTNSLSSTTTVTAGTLLATKAASLSGYTTANRIIFNGGTIAAQVGGSGWTTTEVNTLLTNSTKTSGALGIDTTNGDLTQWTAFTTSNLGANLGLTKLGTNKLILDQTNTYTGATNVNGGSLAVNGSLTATSSVTVANGATLQGSGMINSSVTIQNGATLATGNSIESLGTGTLNLNSGSTFAYEIDKSVGISVGGDLTYVTGDLNIASGAILTLTELNTLSSGSWDLGESLTLISYTGTWNNGLLTYLGSTLNDGDTFTFSGATWEFDYNNLLEGMNYTGDSPDGEFYVTMTVIPEPATALLGCLGLLLLLRRRR